MTGIALALGGGAALGWAHIGVLRVLAAAQVPVAAVAGTSIGALAAACLAADRLDTLEAIARGTTWGKALAWADPAFRRGALLGGRRIGRMLARDLGDLRIEDLALSTALVAADLATGDEVRLTSGPLADAVRASIAIPGVFPATVWEGRRLVDGGMVATLPLAAARALAPGCPLVGVDLFADYAGFIAEAGGAGRIGMAGMARAGFQMLIRGQTRHAARADPPAAMIQPVIGHLATTDFHRADALIAAGAAAAEPALPRIRQALTAAQKGGNS